MPGLGPGVGVGGRLSPGVGSGEKDICSRMGVGMKGTVTRCGGGVGPEMLILDGGWGLGFILSRVYFQF